MNDSSINITGKLDPPTVDLFRSVDLAARRAGAHYLIVGASARDLVHHYGHGLAIRRATGDTDFGVQVENWAQFEAIRCNLIEDGFRETRAHHRLLGPMDQVVDLVPFGGVADNAVTIEWPPEFELVMNVLGFEDALEAAVQAVIDEAENLTVPVASSPGLALLKLIAWSDRESDLRRKDAQDLLYLARMYERLPFVDLYGDNDLLERYEFDVTRIGAHLLGAETAGICSDQSRQYV